MVSSEVCKHDALEAKAMMHNNNFTLSATHIECQLSDPLAVMAYIYFLGFLFALFVMARRGVAVYDKQKASWVSICRKGCFHTCCLCCCNCCCVYYATCGASGRKCEGRRKTRERQLERERTKGGQALKYGESRQYVYWFIVACLVRIAWALANAMTLFPKVHVPEDQYGITDKTNPEYCAYLGEPYDTGSFTDLLARVFHLQHERPSARGKAVDELIFTFLSQTRLHMVITMGNRASTLFFFISQSVIVQFWGKVLKNVSAVAKRERERERTRAEAALDDNALMVTNADGGGDLAGAGDAEDGDGKGAETKKVSWSELCRDPSTLIVLLNFWLFAFLVSVVLIETQPWIFEKQDAASGGGGESGGESGGGGGGGAGDLIRNALTQCVFAYSTVCPLRKMWTPGGIAFFYAILVGYYLHYGKRMVGALIGWDKAVTGGGDGDDGGEEGRRRNQYPYCNDCGCSWLATRRCLALCCHWYWAKLKRVRRQYRAALPAARNAVWRIVAIAAVNAVACVVGAVVFLRQPVCYAHRTGLYPCGMTTQALQDAWEACALGPFAYPWLFYLVPELVPGLVILYVMCPPIRRASSERETVRRAPGGMLVRALRRTGRAGAAMRTYLVSARKARARARARQQARGDGDGDGRLGRPLLGDGSDDDDQDEVTRQLLQLTDQAAGDSGREEDDDEKEEQTAWV